jgi:hypothetical protein
LTCKDICEIIGTCRDSGVLELKFKGLLVSFKSKGGTESAASDQQSHVEEIQELKIDDEKLRFEIEDRQKEDELANMLIENPSDFEQGLARGDFVDAEETDADTGSC